MDKNNLSLNDFRRNSFLFLQENKYTKNVYSGVATLNNTEKINDEYFSKKNIQKLQIMIKKELFKMTNGRFVLSVDQDEKSLLISMKNIYAEHGHLRSVEKLNVELLKFIMPDIVSSVKQYHGYIEKINSPMKPMDRPINANKKGRNQLRSITTVWN